MTDSRTLRNKKHRARLWEAAGGMCQACGHPLPPNWHADHRVPWVVQPVTNAHDMLALCPPCNLKKGKYMLRKHQQDFDVVCQDILAGMPITRIILSVTPGGGKSLIPVIASHRLIPRIADALCWVVPRQSLQYQAEETFVRPSVRSLIGHTTCIRASTNEIDPCRGYAGYVTTYHAITADPLLHANEFGRKRYIIVLDEPHHLDDGGVWHQAIQPLIDRAALVILMSGTWERNDQRPIAFVPYRSPADGILTPDLAPTSTTAVIRYSRTDALRDQAIKPLQFYGIDGHAEWFDAAGDLCSTDSLADTNDSLLSDAIHTALRTDYAHDLLRRCVSDWRAVQRERDPYAKLLVVAATIAQARAYLAYLSSDLGCPRAEIATSLDSQAAQDAIQRYKQPPSDPNHLDALVTVAMAYEGLDVPEITHLACLTHIRSRPWIEQMCARAVRVVTSVPYTDQTGCIYGPDDPLLWQCLEAIRAEQAPFLRDRPATVPLTGSGTSSGDAQPGRGDILPIASAATRERGFHLATGEQSGYDDLAQARAALDRCGLSGRVDPLEALVLVRQLTGTPTALASAGSESIPTTRMPLPSERERYLRQSIEKTSRAVDASANLPPGTTNQAIKQRFRKPRADMTEAELAQVWTWLQQTGGTDQ